MEETLLYASVAAAALVGIVALLFAGRGGGLFTGSRHRLPKNFEAKDVPSGDIPPDARRPLEFLTDKLAKLGFQPADLPARIPSLQRFGYRLLLVPFSHADECTLFLMGIEAGLGPRAQIMLHILTPLTGGRRVETTTLAPLRELARPPNVEAQVVLDADSVEEIWSRHRLALSRHQRAERAPIEPSIWRSYAAAAYEAWVQSAVRAQRLQLESNGRMYRVRTRPKSVI